MQDGSAQAEAMSGCRNLYAGHDSGLLYDDGSAYHSIPATTARTRAQLVGVVKHLHNLVPANLRYRENPCPGMIRW